MLSDRKGHQLALMSNIETEQQDMDRASVTMHRRKVADQKTLARELMRLFFKVRIKTKLFWASPIWGLVLLLIMFGTSARLPNSNANPSPPLYQDFQDLNDSQTKIRTAFTGWIYTPNTTETEERLEYLIGNATDAIGCNTIDEMGSHIAKELRMGRYWAGFELRDENTSYIYFDSTLINDEWAAHTLLISCPQVVSSEINLTHACFSDAGGWMAWSRALVAIEITLYMCFIVLFPGLHMVEFRSLKISLLMTMNGAREFVVCGMFILCDLLSIFPWSVIGTIVLAFSKNGTGASFFLIFFYIGLLTLVYYAICVFFASFSRGPMMFLFLFALLLLCSGIFPFMELGFTEWMPMYVFCLAAFFFPMINVALFIGNMATMQHLSSFTFQNAKYGYYLPTSVLFGLLIASLAMYGLLAFVALVFTSPVVQKGQEGWRRIFRKGFWKRVAISDEELDEIPAKSRFITIENLSKTYSTSKRRTKALNNISFTIKKGEAILLIGPNGCGKTTLIHSLIGAMKADSGEVRIGEYPMSGNFAQLQDFTGFCFQENVCFGSLSVRDHLRFFAALRGFRGREIATEIELLCDSLRLSESLDSRAEVLSGGQKRKLGVAMALIGQPPLIFLDEPTVGVDVSTRQCIWKTLEQFKDSTIFIASHSLEEAECVSDRLFVMRQGTILFQGSSEELRRKFKCGYQLKLTGRDIDMEQTIEFIQVRIPGAEVSPDRPDVILIPYGKNLHELLTRLQVAKSGLGIESYRLSAQKLEDVIVLFIESSEHLNDL